MFLADKSLVEVRQIHQSDRFDCKLEDLGARIRVTLCGVVTDRHTHSLTLGAHNGVARVDDHFASKFLRTYGPIRRHLTRRLPVV